jgi:hypothetical protein
MLLVHLLGLLQVICEILNSQVLVVEDVVENVNARVAVSVETVPMSM